MGWTGRYLCVKLSPEDCIDKKILREIELGIMFMKGKNALVWNSEIIFILTPNYKDFYNHLRETQWESQSPRSIEIEDPEA